MVRHGHSPRRIFRGHWFLSGFELPTCGAARAVLVQPHPFASRTGAGRAHLRILETTDLHVHLLPYDYYADRATDTAGLSRTAAIIAGIRAEAANAILVDNGDFLQGNPMGDYIAYERGMREGDLHPVIAAMNAVGFDAATLGNHEFNYGLDFLMKSLGGAGFPVVAANIATSLGSDPTRDRTLLPPYVILDRMMIDGEGERHPIRIGLIGFVPPQIMTWDRRHLEGRIHARDIVATAEAWVPRMREEGADIIVALSHSGIGPVRQSDCMENASVPLARVEGIDALLTGHVHLVFPGPDFAGIPGVDAAAGTIHGKPAAMGGFWGSHLGLIDLLMERDGCGWRILDHASAARPIYRRNADRSVSALAGDDPVVSSAVEVVHKATLGYVRRPVGRTTAPLHSYFSLVADAPSLRLVARAQAWQVARMLRGTPLADMPLLSASAPFKAGGRGGPAHYTEVPAGGLALRHVADLYIYPNTLRAVRITGAALKDWLEYCAGLFLRVEPGRHDQPLLDPAFASYNFDVIEGLDYEIDPSQPARFDPSGRLADAGAARIVRLTWGGRPVDPAQEFIVATNSYRVSGGGGLPGPCGGAVVFDTPETNRDIIMRYIAERGTIHPEPGRTWSFARLPGTTALFDTGPRAALYLSGVIDRRIEPAGDGPDGFARFRISF
jgi:2',3'-cyclic-nucleotide 2'-phosphodiesterase / 3'-nucleotidase